MAKKIAKAVLMIIFPFLIVAFAGPSRVLALYDKLGTENVVAFVVLSVGFTIWIQWIVQIVTKFEFRLPRSLPFKITVKRNG